MSNQADIIESLNWRYATKQFDPLKKILPADLNVLKQSLRLAPSSFGLQPWKFIHVTNKELREKIKAAAWNQSQVTDASDLFILAAKTDMSEEYIKQFISLISTTRNMPLESLEGYKQMMLGFNASLTPQQRASWSQRQVYIPLGTLLTSAALLKIDACPMEGFNVEQVNEILDLTKEGLTATVLCAIGYRSAEDKTAGYQKVRYPEEAVFSERQ